MEVKSTLPQQRFPPTQIEEQYKDITTTPIENHRVCNEIENQYKEIQTTNNLKKMLKNYMNKIQT
jgi:hypothetical protein